MMDNSSPREYLAHSHQVPGLIGSRNGIEEYGMIIREGRDEAGTRLFMHSWNVDNDSWMCNTEWIVPLDDLEPPTTMKVNGASEFFPLLSSFVTSRVVYVLCNISHSCSNLPAVSIVGPLLHYLIF
uniref:Uncharacterized protein n=1 Tax=Arundo donax TaxID=35708 RepID=A0A0A9DKF4_ARUDO